MTRNIIQTHTAPQAIGAYSQAARVGDLVFISGQIPLIPESGEMESGDTKQQISRVFNNLAAICKEAGGDLNDIVKLTIYLVDLADFPLVNEVMEEMFELPYPARAAVGICALPKNARVEADAILHLNGNG